MGTIYQMTGEILIGDPYIGVWNQAWNRALKQLSASA